MYSVSIGAGKKLLADRKNGGVAWRVSHERQAAKEGATRMKGQE